MKKDAQRKGNILDLIRNIEVLKTLDHPNLLRLVDFFDEKKAYYLITDICQGGDLLEYISKSGKFIEKDAC